MKYGMRILSFVIVLLVFIQIYYIKVIMGRFYYQIELQRKNELKQKVEIAYNTIYPIIESLNKGEISKKDAIDKVTDIVRRMTYKDEYSDNYIFMSTFDGTYLVQPFEKDKEGKNFWDYKDVKGNYVIRNLVSAAKSKPEGDFVLYYATLPGFDTPQPKLSFVKGIPQIEAYIGTGMYIQNTFKVMLLLFKRMHISLIIILILSFSLFLMFFYKLSQDKKLLEKEIKKRKLIEDELLKRNKYLTSLFENSPDALIEFDKDGIITNVNKAFENMFGYKRDECIKRHIDDINIFKDFKEEAKNFTKEFFKKGFCSFEATRFTKDGKPVNVLIRGIIIKVDENIIGGYIIYTDITKQKKYQKKLEYLSFHDGLTGLYNYSFFHNKIKEYSKHEYLPLSIIMADLNGLKLVNDTMGHAYGDKLLIDFCKVLIKTKRKQDLVFRIGGDEFLILLPNTHKYEAEKILKALRENIKEYNDKVKEKIFTLSASFGLATKEDDRDILSVIKEADDNMYKDKLLDKTSSKNQILNVLLTALGEKDYVTKGHTDRVKDMCQKMAEKIRLGEVQKNNLILLADMHDIGKVAIPDNILNKSRPLTKEEWEILKSHSEKGYRIALSSPELSKIAELILKHHERWDGKGYPFGLKGEEIPIECRILAVADAYDAMTNLRPYNKVKTPHEAIEEIKRCSGTQFDPFIVEVFLELKANNII